MKKENEGVLNDNLNFDDLLEFNKKWIALSFEHLKDVGSWYCWGIDESLMDIYSNILKPMAKENKITFRNIITWDKGSGQGENSEDYRMYAIADEKCLFVMAGVQGFNTNADHYFEGWEPIRDYLLNSRLAMGWDVPTMKRIVGHSDLFRDHWTSKSQFRMPTREVYDKMKAEAERQRKEKGIENDAFKREYDDIKREYYKTRAYFDNTHDNMNNVWHFKRTSAEERKTTGGHATPKPLELCERAINTSSRKGELVLDFFGGSGSTLIASEKLGRKCRMIELDERYCDVIRRRYTKWAIQNNKPLTSGCLE
jgi:DNA modification methylase